MRDREGQEKSMEIWLRDYNRSVITVLYELGCLFQTLEDWDNSLKKYNEARVIMEKHNMEGSRMYEMLIEKMEQTKESCLHAGGGKKR